MPKLVIGLSGKDNLTRNAAANFIVAKYLNAKIRQERFSVGRVSKEFRLVDSFNSNRMIPIDYPNNDLENLTKTYSVKVYTFADPVKRFCIDNLGLSSVQCFGSEKDQESSTHLMWEDCCEEIRSKHARRRRGSSEAKPAHGAMTAKEVMTVVYGDIFSKMDPNCWARGLYALINNENHDLAIISNFLRPNEVTIGTESGAKVIRFMKSTGKECPDELDEFALAEYSLVVENQDLSPHDTNKKIENKISEWFRESRLI